MNNAWPPGRPPRAEVAVARSWEPSPPPQNLPSPRQLEYSIVKKTAGKLKFRTQAFIDGKFVNAASGKTYVSVNPAAFTGSTEVGRQLLHYAAESNLKRIGLELGGKNPQLVLADAGDLDSIARQAVNCVFWNMGENCSSGSRLIVQRKLKDKLLAKMLDISNEWIVGDPPSLLRATAGRTSSTASPASAAPSGARNTG